MRRTRGPAPGPRSDRRAGSTAPPGPATAAAPCAASSWASSSSALAVSWSQLARPGPRVKNGHREQVGGGQGEQVALVGDHARTSSRAIAAFQPSPSMSNAPREATWNSRSRSCAGQERALGQRMSTSPSFAGRQRRAARGAVRGHDERALGAGALLDHRPEHLGDHVAGLAQEHHVADQHALALDLAGVVQRGHLHGRAGHLHRLHHGERGHPAGAADVDRDVEQPRAHHLGRVLVGDRPARGPRGGAQPALQREVVDLDHDAVDLVLDVVAVLAVVRRRTSRTAPQVGHDPAAVADVGSPRPRSTSYASRLALDRMPVDAPRCRAPSAAAPPVARTARDQSAAIRATDPRPGQRRCRPAHGRRERLRLPASSRRSIRWRSDAGGGVARVGERRAAQRQLLVVDPLEVRDREEHLAAHLHQRRDRRARRGASRAGIAGMKRAL